MTIRRFDIDDVADLDDLAGRRGRGTDCGARKFAARPTQFAERNSCVAAVVESDLHGFVAVEAQHHRNTPSVDARLIARARQRVLPIALDGDVADSAPPAMAAIVTDEPCAQGVHGEVLQPRIERCAHLQAAIIQRVFAVLVVKQTADFFDEVIGVDRLASQRAFLGDERFGDRRLCLLGRDVAVVGHLTDDPVAAVERSLLVETRIVIAGRFWQRRQISGLRNIELVQRFAEIIERRGGNPVGILSEEYFVEVKLEYLVLRVGGIDTDRQHRFLDLAREIHVAIEQKVSRYLLRDRRSAFRTPMLENVEHVLDGRAHDAARIDAGMAVEILVLSRSEGVDHALGHEGDWHENAPLARILAENRPVAGIDTCRHRWLIILQSFDAGEVARQRIEEPGCREDRENAKRPQRQAGVEKYSPPHTLGPFFRCLDDAEL